MPTPSSGQTLICESVSATAAYQTLHTVTAGKTFYLMGVFAGITNATLHWKISFDGGTTVHIGLSSTNYQARGDYTDAKILTSGWPIAQVAAGEVIQAISNAIDANTSITIWGWEE